MFKKLLSKFKKKKYRQDRVIACKEPEYVEKDTACDPCENLGDCIEDGIVINVQTIRDINKHYVPGLGMECKKDPVVQARDAYRLYKQRYYNFLNLSHKGECDIGKYEASADLLKEAQKEMFNKMDVLFGEVKE